MSKRTKNHNDSNEIYYSAQSKCSANISDRFRSYSPHKDFIVNATSTPSSYQSKSVRFAAIINPQVQTHQMITSTPLSRPGTLIRPVHLRYTNDSTHNLAQDMELDSLPDRSSHQHDQLRSPPSKEELERAEKKYQEMYAHLYKPTKKMGLRV